jgi:hypothetical protein
MHIYCCKNNESPTINNLSRVSRWLVGATSSLFCSNNRHINPRSQIHLSFLDRVCISSLLFILAYRARHSMDSLNSLIAELDEHSRDAEKRFHALPRPVRFKLTAETRSMFQKYAQHGSQARLRHNIKGFLEKGDEGTKLSEISTSKTSDNSATSQPDRRIGQTRSSQRGTKLEGSCVAESRTVDMDSTELIPPPPDGLEFHLDRSFVLNADTTIPQDLLESMDRVFGLYAKQAKLFLGHHCEKYGNEAVFRSGIREWVMR